MGLFDFLRKKKSDDDKKTPDSHITDNKGTLEIPLKMSVGNTTCERVVEISYDFLERFSRNKENKNSCEDKPTQNDVVLRIGKIPTQILLLFPEYFQNKIETTSLRGYNNVVLPKKVWDKAFQTYNEMRIKERLYEKVVSNNLQGKELEKQGDIQGAISLYETNISTQCETIHPYERLMVLYHKQKDFENEIRVIELAISVFSEYNRKRLDAALSSHPEMKEELQTAYKECEVLRGKDGWVIYNPVDIHKWQSRLYKLQCKQKE